jgi:hypothetical protein
MDCGTLRSEKWKACHPTNEPKVGHPRCEAGMSLTELKRIYDAHNMCLSFRQLENQSNCFSSKDKGHQKAEIHEEQESMICLQLIQNYKDVPIPRPQSIPQKSPTYDMDQIDPDEWDGDASDEDTDDTDESEQTPSIFSMIGRGILILLAIIVLLFFIRYVV